MLVKVNITGQVSTPDYPMDELCWLLEEALLKVRRWAVAEARDGLDYPASGRVGIEDGWLLIRLVKGEE